jgi:hypothetical protein
VEVNQQIIESELGIVERGHSLSEQINYLAASGGELDPKRLKICCYKE